MILLLAMADAGETGLRDKELLDALARTDGSASKPLATLTAAGMCTTVTRGRMSAHVLTDHGRNEVAKLISPEVPRDLPGPRFADCVPLLRALRDWTNPTRPHQQLMSMLALDDAGDAGMGAPELAAILGRDAQAIATLLKGAIHAHLILMEPVHRPGVQGGAHHLYTLTALGRKHVRHLLDPQPVTA